jgi:fructokinase
VGVFEGVLAERMAVVDALMGGFSMNDAGTQAPRLLCVGEMLFDRLSDRPGLPLEKVDAWTDYPGGAPANVACAAAKLGLPAGFIGCIGQDESGDTLVKLLQDVGVNIAGVQRHDTAPTRIVYVLRDRDGDRTFAGFGDRQTTEFADTHLQAALLPTALFESAEFIAIGTLALAYPDSGAALTRAIALAEQSRANLFLDVNRRDMFWPDLDRCLPLVRQLLPSAHWLKLTDEEALWLFETTDPAAIAATSDRLQGVWVTAGEQGCRYWLMGNCGEQAAFEVTAVDTTGAGDSFTAGLLYQLSRRSIETLVDSTVAAEIVRYASAVGALTVLKPGAIAAQPTAADVARFLGF